MNLQTEYRMEFPKRKPLNNKGIATKDYEKWLLTKGDPFLSILYEREMEETKNLNDEWHKEDKIYNKKVKNNKKLKPDKNYTDIEELSHPKRVEEFLHPKVKKEKKVNK